jgi:hypothetical protein
MSTIHRTSSRPARTFARRTNGALFEEGCDRTDWQRMWLQTQRTQWRTLALVPGDDSTSTLGVAYLIAKLAFEEGESIHVADLRRLKLKHVDAFLDGIKWDNKHGDRIIFATRSSGANLATIPLARAADCVILCASLGVTKLASARETVEQIGAGRFAGTLLVRPGPGTLAELRREQRLLGRAGP